MIDADCWKKNGNIVICQTIPFDNIFDCVKEKSANLVSTKTSFSESSLHANTLSLSSRAVLMPSISAWEEHVTW